MEQTDKDLNPQTAHFMGRWGCKFMACNAIAALALGSELNKPCIEGTLGKCVLDGSVIHANYKRSEAPTDASGGWSEADDPNWHFLVWDSQQAIANAFAAQGREAEVRVQRGGLSFEAGADYQIVKVACYGAAHYVLYQGEGNMVYNPDSTLPLGAIQRVDNVFVRLA